MLRLRVVKSETDLHVVSWCLLLSWHLRLGRGVSDLHIDGIAIQILYNEVAFILTKSACNLGVTRKNAIFIRTGLYVFPSIILVFFCSKCIHQIFPAAHRISFLYSQHPSLEANHCNFIFLSFNIVFVTSDFWKCIVPRGVYTSWYKNAYSGANTENVAVLLKHNITDNLR